MRYSRNKITKAGEILLTSKDKKEINESQILINEWRTDHLSPLEILKDEVVSFLKAEKIISILISQRLKRLSSIQNKLDLNPQMGLGGMQDIGGIRIVVEDMENLQDLSNLLDNKDIGDFKYQRTTNYISEPKESGYRSIHFIYKYSSTDNTYDGLRFELQIRTKLQHTWATALETVDIHTNTPLKSGYGDEDWLEFFKLVSSLFAHKEKSPTLKEHSKIDLTDLMRTYFRHNREKKHLEFLRAFKVVIEYPIIKTEDSVSDYYLLIIDLHEHKVSIRNYGKDDYEKATKDYYELEHTIKEHKHAIVLVATSSYDLLKEAYPSYFYDIEEFISSLKKVENNCERLGLI